MTDLAPLLGTWCNSNDATTGISRLELAEDDGQLSLHGWSVGQPADWGVVPMESLYTDGPNSKRVCAYSAAFDLGHARARIQTNVVLGLSVVSAFISSTDDTGPTNYLSREYFHRWADLPATEVPDGLLPIPGPPPPGVATRADRFVNRWVNTDDLTPNVSTVDCYLRDDQFYLRVTAVGPDGPVEWPETLATPYLDITGAGAATVPAMLATCEQDTMRVHLQVRLNLGLMVMSFFTEFTDDSGRSDYFRRELFAGATPASR